MKVYIAVDPGQSGALAAISESGDIAFKDFTNETSDMVEWLTVFKENHDVVMCMVEDVHAIYGTSAKSTFNFGRNLGIMLGIIRGLSLPIDYVAPKAWQKFIGSKAKGKDIKKDVAEIARRLYPGCDIYTPRGRLLDGRSDALMIAHYCKLKYK